MTELRGRAFLDGSIENDVTIRFASGRIDDVAVGSGNGGGAPLILPGFIDTHVHGAAGADFMDGLVEGVRTAARTHALHGTTCLAATTLSGPGDQILAAIHAIVEARATATEEMPEIAAIHFEGPYLHENKAGAQDKASLRPPSSDEIDAWIAAAGDLPLLMTVAPDRDGVLQAIERYASRILFSIGHTEASFELCLDAIGRGASHFTHLFNAMPPFHHRNPGPVGAAIASARTTVELIADGVHVHPVALASMARLMPGRVALMTDAMRACGMGDGSFRLYDYDVTVRGGEARLADGTLAGSLLTMDGAVRNMVRLAGLDLGEVVPLATETPARILGVADRKGRIASGFDADLVVMNDDLEIERVFVRGREILGP